MKKIVIIGIFVVAGLLTGSAMECFAYGSYGDQVNAACTQSNPYSGDCTLCHTTGAKSDPTPAKAAFLAGVAAMIDFFCPSAPTCTDNDGDAYAIEGGSCGPVDCDDNDAAIHPGAVEVCTDNIDNDCDGLIDSADGNAVGCPTPCTDNDGDGYAIEGGTCGPVDCNDNNAIIHPNAVDIPNNGIDENCDGQDSVDPSLVDNDGDGYTVAGGDCNDSNPAINPGAVDIPNNGIDENCDGQDSVDPSIVDNDGDGYTTATGDCDDTDAAINPGAVENCSDGLDNNCNGLIDTLDALAVNCSPACTDNDADGYATEGGVCGPVDCNDNDPAINPGAQEVCGDTIDNDCDGLVDEGCDANCPDVDGDGYPDASCGGTDCDDANAAINPGTAEICGNGIDDNCNGNSDENCSTCPDGSVLIIREVDYDREKNRLKIEGRANVQTTISILDADTGQVLAENIGVKEGKWTVTLTGLNPLPLKIRAITAEGCFKDRILLEHMGGDDHEDEHGDEDRNQDEDRDRDEDGNELQDRGDRHRDNCD